PFQDHRGEFVETWNDAEYLPLLNPATASGTETRFVQDNISVSHKGVIRGLHGDTVTWKLVQVVRGEFCLGVVDLRGDSPSFLRTRQWSLTTSRREQILVPPGCVTGYQCLSSEGIVSYKQTSYYPPAHPLSLRYDCFGLLWPLANPILSERDRAAAFYRDRTD